MSLSGPLEHLCRDCVVSILERDGHGAGTGFFVLPRVILTCDHVLSDDAKPGTEVSRSWLGHDATRARVKQRHTAEDLVLLELETNVGDHPCVLMHPREPELRDTVYVYGFAKKPDGSRRGEPASWPLWKAETNGSRPSRRSLNLE